jgi:ABC-type transporter Mla subunit MlaD
MLRILALFAAAALLAAGCGGSDDESEANDLTAWADQLCSAVSGWSQELTDTRDALQGGDISEDSLQNAADGVKSATDTLVDDLRDIPRPETDAGQQAKDSVDQLADELEQEADKIESAVDDASGVSGVLTAVSTVSATLVTMGNQVRSAVAEVEQADAAGELRQAFDEAVSCTEFERVN